jgi:hypothetical protein
MMHALANQLIAACRTRDRASICRVLESIPREEWDVIPGKANADLDGVKVQVWHTSGGSGINSYEKVYVQVVPDVDEHPLFADTFTATELQLPNYITLEQRPVLPQS